MSGRESRRRKRKVQRESNKDEVRCCIDSFGDILAKADTIESFPNRDIHWLTSRYMKNKYERALMPIGEILPYPERLQKNAIDTRYMARKSGIVLAGD